MTKPIIPLTLSEIKNPKDVLREPGDELSIRITKSNKRVSKLNTKDFKRSKIEYPNGRVVETISY